MAKDKHVMDKKMYSDVSKMLQSDTFKINGEFFDKNAAIVKQANVKVINLMQEYGYRTNNTGVNPLSELSTIIRKTVDSSKLTQDMNMSRSHTKSGIRSIVPNGTDSAELDIINSFSSMISNTFLAIPEYRNIVELIPEVARVLDIVARDIRNPSEFDKKCFINLYNDPNLKPEVLQKINDILSEKIVDKYKLEKKLKQWIPDALICGCKPIMVVPYKDILKLYFESSKTKDMRFVSAEALVVSEAENSYESHISEFELTDKAFTYENIITDDVIEDFVSCSFHSIHGSISKEALFDDDKKIITETEFNEFTKNLKDMDTVKRKEGLRSKLREVVDFFDENIEIIKTDKSTMALTKTDFMQKYRYNKMVQNSFVTKNDTEITEIVDGGGSDGSRKETSIDAFKTIDESVIVEFQPEQVIPVVISGETVGYYIIEYDNFFNPTRKKKNTSFTDLISSLGYGNDAGMVSGGSGGMSINPKDPLESGAFSPMGLIGSSTQMSSNSSFGTSDRRYEILKNIALKTISRRLKDPTLENNKSFKDAIFNMLRNDYIIRNKVQFTYVPAENMVYFAKNVDSDGIPSSILKGTLFKAYMYLSSLLSSLMIKLMKSADKEKLLVNLGLSGNAGYTLDEIEKNLTTRSVYASSMFNNVASVIKNSSVFSRVRIPVIDGEQLYDIEQIEKTNDISPDDELTKQLLTSILSKIGVPPSILNFLDDAEYSRSLIMQNLEYKNNITDSQGAFEDSTNGTTKLLRILLEYEPNVIEEIKKIIQETTKDTSNGNDSNVVDNAIEFDITKIEHHFNPPNYLNMTNTNEQISTANDLINNITPIYGDDGDNDVTKERARIFKEKLYKDLVKVIDWKKLDQMYDSADKEAPEQVSRNIKLKKEATALAAEDPNNMGGGGGFGGTDTSGGMGDMFGDTSGGGEEGGDLGGGMGF